MKRTGYIRQFENFSARVNLLVGAIYLLCGGRIIIWSDYYGSDRPLLGYYSSNRREVVEKHVDWATGHGISFFLINWSGRGGFQDTA